MIKTKPSRKKLTSLEIRCIRKFYFADGNEILESATPYFKSLGIEKGFEVILRLAQEEPITLKIKSYDEDNFTIYFDEDTTGKFEPMFIMKNGEQTL